MSVYRKDDIVVVAPNAAVRADDRVVRKSRSGEVLAKQLTKAMAQQVRLASVKKVYEDIVLSSNDVVWIPRSFGFSQ